MGITHLALSAVDVALWDLKAKAANMPLWKLLGGSHQKRIQAYNTDGGWLNFNKQQLVDDCKRFVEEDGYKAVKLKVGGEHTSEDIRRVEAVRHALGPEIQIMTDANGRWSLPQAINATQRLSEFDITWIEEPIYFDDCEGHKRLAQSSPVPIAMGEQLYTADQFRDFISQGAVHYVQADAVRLAGVTEWWQVADTAHSYHLPVVPHVGDMVQLHLQLCIAHPACSLLEYIPWLQEWMLEPVKVSDGMFVLPTAPGAGTEPNAKAFAQIDLLKGVK
jgi:L-alanine-DL-glutamate epimerase-like enolase superfamily enzyme